MANTIKLKRASGSDPSASDLVVGEVALRTDTAKLFTKKDDNSVAEIGGGGAATGASHAIQTTDGSGNFTASNTFTINGDTFQGHDLILVRDSGNADPTITPGSLANITFRTCTSASGAFGSILNNSGLQLGRNTEYVKLAAPADQSGQTSYTLTFPPISGTNGQALTTNGSGTTSWTTIETDLGVSTSTTAVTITSSTGDNAAISEASGSAAGVMSVAHHDKLDGIAASATNVTNTNQLTNGAGFITATLTNEQVQDIVGGMVTGNTESGITVTYQDGDGTLDFVVGTLNQNTTGSSASCTGNAATATQLANARTIAGVSFNGTANISLNNNAITNGAGYITSADGGNAATLDSLDSTSFLRSDAEDSTSAPLNINGGTANASNDATLHVTATNNNDWGLIVDKYNSSATEYGMRIDIASGSNYGLQIRGNNSEVFRVAGDGDVFVAGTVDGRDIASDGSKLDGIASGATNVTNNNQLTNGAGYITSANGGNAATLDSIDSSQFARSDTADTLSGLMTFTGGASFGADARCTAGVSSLSDGSTISVNFISGIHHSVTLGGNRTMNPSNDGNAVGQSGSIFITQDGTGSRTLAFHSNFKFAGGTAPTLSTAANAVDRIDYVIKASNFIHCAFTADVK